MKQLDTLPRLTVSVDGRNLDDRSAASLESVVVLCRLAMPSVCELRFADPPGPLSAGDALMPGTTFRVTVSAQGGPVFEGQVTAVTHRHDADRGHELLIRGYDVLHRLRKRQRPRVLSSTSAGQLARELTADLGISVRAATDGPKLDRIIQHRQSDLELLVDVCGAGGLYPVMRGGVLHLLTLDGDGEPVELNLGMNLLEARVEVNGDLASSSVSAAGWHPLVGNPGRGQAGSPRVGRRVAIDISAGKLGGLDSRSLIDESVSSDGMADALAQAELDRRVSSEVAFHGLVDGDSRLRPGARVTVSGVASQFSGTYVLTEVKHRIDEAGGFTSELDTTPPDARPRPHATVATPAVVTKVDDPDGLGRVQVTLPTFGDIQTGWMPVLGLGAGKGKGLVLMPDVGDEVLLLLAHEDPDQGIVIGGLYGAGGPVDPGIVGGATRRFSLLTAGGSKVRIDDHDKSIRIQDPTGSFVEMTPQKVTVHAEVDLEIASPGHRMTFKAKAVDFETA
ncbi:MAG TPA: phage baseplate assembly protein V [Candidatus Dormibacteraeota bacterium]|nr:phage baseplate assembly protein V [Candidatus Dormibacteraeota bacterium]